MPLFGDQRQQIIEQSRPLLHPGEVVAHVVRALEGPNRWIGLAVALVAALGLGLLVGAPILGLPVFLIVFTRLYARRMILATDESLVVVAGTRFRFTPRAVLDRLDLETPIGPLKGLWLQTTLNGRRLYVVARSAPEVRAADADLLS
jgi:hypothetical protein